MRSPTPRQWTGIALAAVALPALTATAWPLLVFLRGLLPDDLPIGRILLGAALVAVLVIAAALIRAQRRTSFRLWWLILAAWAVAIGAVAGMVVLIWLVLGTPGLDLPTDLSPRALDAIATRAFAVVAGLGGVALLVIHYRRQRTTEADAVRAEAANVRAELAAEREVAKLFTDTFDSASDKLGSEHAAVRLAGVHALARLADEAPEGREDLVQMVIDVLCAYLRVPYTPSPDDPSEQPDRPVLPPVSPTTAVGLGPLHGTAPDEARREKQQAAQEERRRRGLEFASFREVRHTIIRIIGNHLREPTRWRGKNYDFTGVVFDGGDLHGAVFSAGTVGFGGAEFSGGTVDFGGAEFSGGRVDFGRAKFSGGTVNFGRARFTGGEVSFHRAEFTSGTVNFGRARFIRGEANFDRARFFGGTVGFGRAKFFGGTVGFGGAEFSGGTVDFNRARFTSGTVGFGGARFFGGTVDFGRAEFSGGEVSFHGARFTGGRVDFGRAEFFGGTVDFGRAEFFGGTVGFGGARFFGGTVDFGRARFTGGEVSFEDVSGTCPNGLVEAIERAESVVALPEHWQRTAESRGKEGAPETSADAPDH
ncbi:pentapeptide repeat-containing protein [Nocardiopsis protaetiae]|uniref:pentapeptide repeat-containing protein n=1 Tax=Nocardiopsis protaetiae TaxID=3382270 RepID=UPI00387B65DA